MKNVAPCATIVLVPQAVGGLRSRICRRPGNYECFQGDAAHDQRSRRRPSHCTQAQARAARRRSVRCGYRDAAYYTHTHVHTPPTSVSVGAYESDNESDDAVDDQKGRRRQPESDEARAVHILRCLSRESQGAPPSRAQVQRPKKKDLSYCSLNIRGRAPPHGPRSSRGGGACLLDGGPGVRPLLAFLLPLPDLASSPLAPGRQA